MPRTFPIGYVGSPPVASNSVPFSATPTFVSVQPIQVFKMTLTGNVTSSTFTPTATVPASIVTFELTQDGTGGRTFAWPTNVIGGAVINTTPSTLTSQNFFYDGVNLVAIGPGVTNA